MVLQDRFKTGYLAISVLFAATLCVQGSEDDDWHHCPTKREWASTIDPENRAFFQMFSEAAIGAHGPDGYASQGMVAVDLLYSLMTHAYQDTSVYRDVYAELFKEMSKESWTRERFGGTALLEISQCMSGNQHIDCAQMALEKGYLKPLDDLINEPSFNEALQFLKDNCEKK
ncbi:hypothetical protein IWQ51_006741 [Labrenzia sp. EL_142]|nr:hypothetical protein [Labrenzia sp. EL_142]